MKPKTGDTPLTIEDVISKADALKTTGQAPDAARLYEAWIAADDSPSRCVALFNLGVLRSDMGDLDGAEAAYGKTVPRGARMLRS